MWTIKSIGTKKSVSLSSNFIQNSQVITRLFLFSPLFLRKHKLNTWKNIGHFTQRPKKLFFLGKRNRHAILRCNVRVAEDV